MKIKIEIKNRYTDQVLFELEKENNTIKETVLEAVKSGAGLYRAYLHGADLTGAGLYRANLTGAGLYRANLTGAYLYGIKISKAIFISGLYKYQCGAIIAEDGSEYIKLGCYIRLLTEWESDFWNNPNEFTNDNSVKSNLRVLAFETCKKWIEINREAK